MWWINVLIVDNIKKSVHDHVWLESDDGHCSDASVAWCGYE